MKMETRSHVGLARSDTQKILNFEQKDLDDIQKFAQMKLMDFDSKIKWIDNIVIPILSAYKSRVSDVDEKKITLETAQIQYEEKVGIIINRTKESYERWLKEREKEVKYILDAKYRVFYEENTLPIFKIAHLKHIQDELDEKIRQAELENTPEEHLKQAILEFFREQKDVLLSLIEKIEIPVSHDQKEKTLSFLSYKKYYDSKRQEFLSLDEYQKILDKAKIIALHCFRFFPQPLFALDTFRSMIQLDHIKDSCDDNPILCNVAVLKNVPDLIQQEVESFQSMQDLLIQSQLEHQESAEAVARKKQIDITILQNRDTQRKSNPKKIIDVWDACKRGTVEDVKRFNINSERINDLHKIFDYTLLDYAIERKETSIIQYLLERNACPGIINKTGFSSIHRAAYSGNLEGIQACLRYSQSFFYSTLDFNQLSETNPPLTPLNIAIQPELLIGSPSEHRKNVDRTDDIYHFWRNRILSIVKILISNGARIHVENSFSSLDLAISGFIHHIKEEDTLFETFLAIIHHLVEKGNPTQEDILSGLCLIMKNRGIEGGSISVFRILLLKYPVNKRGYVTHLLNLLKEENVYYQKFLLEHFEYLVNSSKLSRDRLQQCADEHTLPYIRDYLEEKDDLEEKPASLSSIFSNLVSPRSRSPKTSRTSSPVGKSRSIPTRSYSTNSNKNRRRESLSRSDSNNKLPS